MRVYLDDCRETPEGFDCRAYTAEEAIALVDTGLVTHISLDFDLGWAPRLTENGTYYEVDEDPNAPDGGKVARRIMDLAYCNYIPRMTWELHTDNPVGRAQMKRYLQFADLQWDLWEEAMQELVRLTEGHGGYDVDYAETHPE